MEAMDRLVEDSCIHGFTAVCTIPQAVIFAIAESGLNPSYPDRGRRSGGFDAGCRRGPTVTTIRSGRPARTPALGQGGDAEGDALRFIDERNVLAECLRSSPRSSRKWVQASTTTSMSSPPCCTRAFTLATASTEMCSPRSFASASHQVGGGAPFLAGIHFQVVDIGCRIVASVPECRRCRSARLQA